MNLVMLRVLGLTMHAISDISSSSSESKTKRKLTKQAVDIKPFAKKSRVKTQTQAIHELAKSFCLLGEAQQKRSEALLQAEKERQAEFLKFQREQAKCNREHELKMLEIVMKYGQNSGLQPQNQHQFYSSSSYSQPRPAQAPIPASGFIDHNHGQVCGTQGFNHHSQVHGSEESQLWDLDNQTTWSKYA